MRTLCTIGCSQKGLRRFLDLLREAGVTRVVDIRLHNTSQLAGFAKKEDLACICELAGIEYVHLPELAPTEEILQRYRKVEKDPTAFHADFRALLVERQAEKLWETEAFATGVPCLLCSEHLPEHCHRKVVAEYFQAAHPEIVIKHLY
ncbi:MAG TPA: DUF488 domain-containing protein [Symbiobacteriaceae bacterium]|jgi:uncharacterized protein (DUF488 family)|nr:DUF488 domain-containing protein [Symbiobacteriaceae bacterium]